MRQINRLSAAALLSVTGLLSMNGADGIRIDHLGTNNTLIRVTDNARYILFPVEESVDDATVNLLLDGKQESTIYVRLARNKVDYYVPFDLSGYKDHTILFNVITSQGRTSVREAKDDACWKSVRLSESFDSSNVEQYRPLFHHTPLYGWMNDPNGMFYKDGEWHLYYQWNPYGSKWQNMTWGHSSSPDLVNWQHHPAAIEPNGLGSVFSGSAAIDTEGSAGFGKDAVVAMYTSAGASQIQSLAVSHDNGETFSIYPGNPVLTLDSEARDPNMFWNPDTRQWTMILAHPLEHEMLIFSSPDMKEWTLSGSFGKGLGAQDGVWECPDLFRLPVDGTDTYKWVLICNINPGGPFGGSGTQYFTGDFDGTTFTADTDPSGHVPTKWMDFGKDNYATVSWSDAPDGRRTVIGWMSNWQYAAEVPTRQFRSANTLPRELALFTAGDGQLYLSSSPSPEIEAIRGKLTGNVKKATVGRSPRRFALPGENDGVCEILMDIDPLSSKAVDIEIGNAEGEKTILTYDVEHSTLSFDRRQSGITDFSSEFPAVTTAPLFAADGSLSLRIFIDRSSMEVFADNGRSVMTNLVFPTKPYTSMAIRSTKGNARIKNLKIYSVNITK